MYASRRLPDKAVHRQANGLIKAQLCSMTRTPAAWTWPEIRLMTWVGLRLQAQVRTKPEATEKVGDGMSVDLNHVSDLGPAFSRAGGGPVVFVAGAPGGVLIPRSM